MIQCNNNKFQNDISSMEFWILEKEKNLYISFDGICWCIEQHTLTLARTRSHYEHTNSYISFE